MSAQIEALAAGMNEEIKRQTVVLESCLARIAELEARSAFVRQQVVNYIDAFERDPKTAEQHERAWRHLLNDLK